MRHERLQLLATIADLYYIEQLSQAEIARKTGYSRSAISRLLTEAREQGVVEIRIHHPLERSAELEYGLTYRFDLQKTFVAQRGNLDYARTLRLIGRLGAAYLSDNLEPDGMLGISWGTALHEVAQAFRPRYYPHFEVVQMIGSAGTGNPLIDGHEVARSIATIFSGKYHTLNAPHIVESPQVCRALLQEKHIKKTLSLVNQIDYAVVGIGSVDPTRSSFMRAGYLTKEQVKEIAAAGAVGDICGRHFDCHGRVLDIPINHCVVGIELEALKHPSCITIGVAAGRVKAPAILGALRGGLIDILITDSTAAEAILALEEPRFAHYPIRT